MLHRESMRWLTTPMFAAGRRQPNGFFFASDVKASEANRSIDHLWLCDAAGRIESCKSLDHTKGSEGACPYFYRFLAVRFHI
jgi:hypothetical protein